MQTPGTRYVGRCTHCGNKEREVTVFVCQWGDGCFSVERLCDICAPSWGRSLVILGCKLTPEPLDCSTDCSKTRPVSVGHGR